MDSFADLLRGYHTELSDVRQRGASEDSIRDAFLRFLHAAFPRLQQADPILLEKHIPGMRVRGGFADALYADLIFECKRRLDEHSRAEGREELTRYVRNQTHPEHHLGILTDGELLEVYALRQEHLDKVDELRLSVPEAEHAHTWLDCYLFHEKHLTPTANDVALRFGEHSPTFVRGFRILEELWQQIGSQPAAQTKFAEWQSLLSIVYGSHVGDEALFLRHTYLAHFARVLAFVALERRAPQTDELAGMITGSTFERMGFESFIDDDFFAWISDPAAAPATRNMLLAIATRLAAAYDLDAIREDLLKELYQELVDPQTRHDLGEFYTPDWLAELTLRKAGFPGKKGTRTEPSLLDPSCGSGTFLFIAVRLLREAGWKGKHLVEFCSKQLAGIDVHPLAVTIAKSNLILALGKDVKGLSQRIALPIYMADTISAAKAALQEKVVHVPVDVSAIAARAEKPRPRSLAGEFDLPAALADKPEVLYETLNALMQFADPQISNADAVEALRHRLEELGVSNGGSYIWRSNLALMRWLLTPPATDTVWRFVLRNAYQPELMARRRFAFVVGNPPWLSYHFIKRRDYQEKVRALAVSYGLAAKRHLGLLGRTELATLFYAYGLDRYVADGGVIAFVMPRSILTGAKQHTTFREHYVAQARFLIDCEQVSPLFRVPACVVIASRLNPGSPPLRQGSLDVLHLRGSLPSRNASLPPAVKVFEQSQGRFSLLGTDGKSPYWDHFLQGADIIPRSMWFVRPPETSRIVDDRCPHLETDPAALRLAKPPWHDISLNGKVEADFLFGTLLSSHLLPFGSRLFSLVVLPLVHGEASSLRLLDYAASIRSGKAAIAQWLRQAEKVWKARAKESKLVQSIYDRLDYLGKLTAQRPKGAAKVVYNKSGTHLCARVIDKAVTKKLRLYSLNTQGYIPDQTTYWFEAVGPEEAHFLCAVLNAPRVDKAIKPYQTKGAFGAQRGKGERDIHRRPFEVLPIPRYDSKDNRHRELAGISERCHAKVAQVVADADEKWLKAPIGRLRTGLRQGLLKDDLAEIDGVVAEILEQA